jgi:hypothetical protein
VSIYSRILPSFHALIAAALLALPMFSCWAANQEADPPVIQGNAAAVAVNNVPGTACYGYTYVIGSFTGTRDFDPSGNTDEKTAIGAQDVFVTCFRLDGSYAWTTTFGGSGDDRGLGICASGSTVYAVGYFASQNAGFNGVAGAYKTYANSIDAFVMALDCATGTPVSTFGVGGVTTFGGTGTDVATGVAWLAGANRIFVSGYFDSGDAKLGGAGQTLSTLGGSDAFVLGLTSTGAAISNWGKSASGVQIFGGSQNDFAYGLCVGGTEIYVTGEFASWDAGVGVRGPAWPNSHSWFATAQNGNSDCFVIDLAQATGASNTTFNAFDAVQNPYNSGGIQTFGGSDRDVGWSVAFGGNTVYIAGQFSSGVARVGGEQPPSLHPRQAPFAAAMTDAFLISLQANGQPNAAFDGAGVRTFGGSDIDAAYSVVYSDQHVYVAGHFRSPDAASFSSVSGELDLPIHHEPAPYFPIFPDDFIKSEGGSDAFVLCFDTAGVPELKFHGGGFNVFGGTGDDVARGLAAFEAQIQQNGQWVSQENGEIAPRPLGPKSTLYMVGDFTSTGAGAAGVGRRGRGYGTLHTDLTIFAENPGANVGILQLGYTIIVAGAAGTHTVTGINTQTQTFTVDNAFNPPLAAGTTFSYSWAGTGTVLSNTGTDLVGSNTVFVQELVPGDVINVGGALATIASIQSDTQATLSPGFGAPPVSGAFAIQRLAAFKIHSSLLIVADNNSTNFFGDFDDGDTIIAHPPPDANGNRVSCQERMVTLVNNNWALTVNNYFNPPLVSPTYYTYLKNRLRNIDSAGFGGFMIPFDLSLDAAINDAKNGKVRPRLDLNGATAGYTGIDYTTTFTEGQGAVFVGDPNRLRLTDIDSYYQHCIYARIYNPMDPLETINVGPGPGMHKHPLIPDTWLCVEGRGLTTDYQAVLRNIVYNNPSTNPDRTPRLIEIKVWDNYSRGDDPASFEVPGPPFHNPPDPSMLGDEWNNSSDLATSTIYIIPANSAPVISIPDPQPAPDGQSVTLSALNGNLPSISDDSGGFPIKITLNGTNGIIGLSTTSGLSFLSGANNSAAMSFTGSLDQVNTAFDKMTFTTPQNFHSNLPYVSGDAAALFATQLKVGDTLIDDATGQRRRVTSIIDDRTLQVSIPHVPVITGSAFSFERDGTDLISSVGTIVTVSDADFAAVSVGDWIVVGTQAQQIGSMTAPNSVTVGGAFVPDLSNNFFRFRHAAVGTISSQLVAVGNLTNFVGQLKTGDTIQPSTAGKTVQSIPLDPLTLLPSEVTLYTDAPFNPAIPPGTSFTLERAGSNVITVSGTAVSGIGFQLVDNIQAGDIIHVAGLVGQVASVGADTSITLTNSLVPALTLPAGYAYTADVAAPSGFTFERLGTGTIYSQGTTVNGSGSQFATELQIGDILHPAGQPQTVSWISNNTTMQTVAQFSPPLPPGTPVSLHRAGTGTLTSSGFQVTGAGTAFLTEVAVNDLIYAGGQVQKVSSVLDNGTLFTVAAFTPALAGQSFMFERNAQGTVATYSPALLRIDVDDQGHTGGEASGTFLTDSKVITFIPQLVDDPAVITMPPQPSTIEEKPIVFSIANGNPIAITDDSGNENIAVALSAQFGTLTLRQNFTNLQFLGGANSSPTMTIYGQLSDINHALDGLVYQPNPNFNVNNYTPPGATTLDTLQISTVDLANVPSNLMPAVVSSLAIQVLSANDPPWFTGQDRIVVDEDSGAYSAVFATNIQPYPSYAAFTVVGNRTSFVTTPAGDGILPGDRLIAAGQTRTVATVPSSLQSGTGLVTVTGTAVVGSGTFFTTQLMPGDTFHYETLTDVVASITDDTHLTLTYGVGNAVAANFSLERLPILTTKVPFYPALPANTPYRIQRDCSGVISSTGTTVTGVLTQFSTQIKPGDMIVVKGWPNTAALTVTNDTSLALVSAFTPPLPAGTRFSIERTPPALPAPQPTVASAISVLGAGTSFTTQLQVGDVIGMGADQQTVVSVVSDTLLEVMASFSAAQNMTPFWFLRPATGTCSTSVGNPVLSGANTKFTTEIRIGDVIHAAGQTRKVIAIADPLTLTVDRAFSPVLATGTYFSFQRQANGAISSPVTPFLATDEVNQNVTFTVTNSDSSKFVFNAAPAVALNPADTTQAILTFTPAPNANCWDGAGITPVKVTVTAHDNGTTDNGGIDAWSFTFDLFIVPINDTPVAYGQALHTPAGQATSPITLTGDDGDPEATQTMIFSITSDAAHGKLSGTNLGTGTITSPAGTPTAISGAGTTFTTQLAVGDVIFALGEARTVTAIGNGTALTVDRAFVNAVGAPIGVPAATPFTYEKGQSTKVIYTPDMHNGAGTVSVAAASTTVTGTGTAFNTELAPGYLLTVGGESRQVTAIASATSLTVASPFSGVINNAPYTVTFVGQDTFKFTVTDNGLSGMPLLPDPKTSPAATVFINVGINDMPSFTKGSDQVVLEDGPIQTIPNWASAISPASVYPPPPEEATQSVFFIVSNDNNALFAVQPTISSTGTLTYTPAPNRWGVATVTVVLRDNGTPIQSSLPQTFTITITPVNDAPSFTSSGDVTANENDSTKNIAGWASNISPGPFEPQQTVVFVVTTDNPNLFTSTGQPAVRSDGTLSFTPAANVNGTANVTVVAKDDGGTANGGVDTSPPQTFVITVAYVNQPPSYTKGPNVTVPRNAGNVAIANWATNIIPGPSDEVNMGQTVTFGVTVVSNAGLFAVMPAISPDGTLTFTPLDSAAPNTALVSVLATDTGTPPAVTPTPQTFTITTTMAPRINHTPSADNQNGVPTLENKSVGITLTGNDNDGSVQTLTFNLIPADATHGPFNGTITAFDPATGAVIYQPNVNYFGSDSFSFTVTDHADPTLFAPDSLTSPPALVTINIAQVNQKPSFVPGPSVGVQENSGLFVQPNWATGMVAGPANENNQTWIFTATIASVTAPFTAASFFATTPGVDPTGQLTFEINPNAVGTATINVTMKDSGGTANGGIDLSDVHSFTITVAPINDAPVVPNPGPQTGYEERAGTIRITGIYPGPAAGPDEFTQRVTLSVVANDPTALTTLTIAPALVVGAPPWTATISYLTKTDWSGSLQLTVTAVDDGTPAATTSTTFGLNIINVNNPPVFTLNPSAINPVLGDEGGPQVSIANFCTNIYPYDPLSPKPAEAAQTVRFAVVASNPAFFLVQPAISAAGTLTFTPKDGIHGDTTATVQAIDSGGTANGGIDRTQGVLPSFNIHINPVNTAPTAVPSTVSVLEGASLPITLTGNSNDTEDVQTLTFNIVTQPANGTISPLTGTMTGHDPGTATVTYTPTNLFFNGTDSFTFTVTDDGNAGAPANLTSAPATVTLNVIAVNHAPQFTLGPDITVLEDSLAYALGAGFATGISAGPANESTQTLTFTCTTSNDTLFSVLPAIDVATGTLTFTPAPFEWGTATVTVKLQDNGGTANGGVDSTTKTFIISVTHINHPPVAVNDTYNCIIGRALVVPPALGVLANDTDPDGDVLTVMRDVDPSVGTLDFLNPVDGSFSYTPPAAYAGPAITFTYKLTDNPPAPLAAAPSNVATVTINFVTNSAPVATNATYNMQENGLLKKQLAATDANSDPLTYALVSNGTLGTVVLTDASNGSFTYTPKPYLNGTDSFTFQATDGTAVSNIGKVTIVIAPVDYPPVAVSQNVSTGMNNALAITLSATDPDNFAGDPDNAVLTFKIASQPVHGTLSGAGALWTFTPAANYFGSDSFTFTASDGKLTSAPATVNIVMSAPPVFSSNPSFSPAAVVAGQPFTGSASAGDATIAWDWGDGSQSSGQTATHTYANPGVYVVTVTATSPQGVPTVYSTEFFVGMPLAGSNPTGVTGTPPDGVSGILVGGPGVGKAGGGSAKVAVDYVRRDKTNIAASLGNIAFPASLTQAQLIGMSGVLLIGPGDQAEAFVFTLDKNGKFRATGLPGLQISVAKKMISFKANGHPGVTDIFDNMGGWIRGVKKGPVLKMYLPVTLRVGDKLYVAMTFQLQYQQNGDKGKAILAP